MNVNRRRFLKTTAATALYISSLDLLAAKYKPDMDSEKQSDLQVLATNWGFQGSLDSFCAKASQEGYNGIEIWWPQKTSEQDELFACLKKHKLVVGFLCGSFQANYEAHFDQFTKMTEAAARNQVQKPLYINCHSGKDYFSYAQNKAFIDFTTQLSKATGILICHETHRSRMLYSAPASREFMEKNPELKITFDVSHWCNVSESLLQDQPETMKLAVERAGHIHARIGHAQGPQVSDPRAPEWESAVNAHLNWWDAIVKRKRASSEPITILTEFGPPDYMPTTPYSRQPLADQWAINVHMMQLLRKRYQTI